MGTKGTATCLQPGLMIKFYNLQLADLEVRRAKDKIYEWNVKRFTHLGKLGTLAMALLQRSPCVEVEETTAYHAFKALVNFQWMSISNELIEGTSVPDIL
ncbi:hypothetical protein PsorP6_016843 [Peronosclerospora sorghi]|uniref:Uncharacterized protein n=1 Tax=Peronosclerospora sorghi TaxID=230839 RepID=A0ACC0WCP2_9STRA|nr:hypothetical protein PsorP6_016843 [Peronosclerospora sorghi]